MILGSIIIGATKQKGAPMVYRYLFIAIVLLTSAILTDASSNSQYAQTSQTSYSYQNCANCKHIHVWIDGVRWMFVYAEDGSLINNYPDPEY